MGDVTVMTDVQDVVSLFTRPAAVMVEEWLREVGPDDLLVLSCDETDRHAPSTVWPFADGAGVSGPAGEDRAEAPGPAGSGSGSGSGSGAGAAVGPVARLEGVLEALDDLAGTDWHEVPGKAAHGALDLVEQVERRLAGVRSQVLCAIEGDGTWALDGSRTFAAWLRRRTDATTGSAARQVRESRALRDHLPLTRGALEAGEIGAEHVRVLVREALVTERLRAQLGDPELGEAFLLEQARVMDAGTFTRLVKAWAIAADPEAAERNWREADAKEELTVAPTLGGYHVSGWLDELSGQVVTTALEAHMGRKGEGDERTPSQRRAAALVSLAHQSLDNGLQGAHARVRPHVTVTTSLETLRGLVAAMGSAVPPHGTDAASSPGADGAASSPGADGAGPSPGADGVASGPGAAFGLAAQASLTAPGGPQDPQAAGAEESLFDLSPEARAWVADWRAGDDHVISTAIDHHAMAGLAPARFEDSTPLAPALLARLVCESGLSRVVFGAESTVLDVGREKRIFLANQAKAIIARDRHCQYPGCDEPPGFGEIHHSLHWYKDHGPTSVEHGVLLCWHHHTWVHANTITILRSAGRWHFTDRHGRPITARHRPDHRPPPPPPAQDDDEPPPTLQG